MATEANIHMQESGTASFLSVRKLGKQYRVRSGRWGSRALVAVDGISFEIGTGKTLALVGSSGSGKSTVARCVTRLERPDGGSILMGGADIAQLRSHDLLPFRTQVQMVFQDPATSMNPRLSAGEVIQEPLAIQRHGKHEERRNRAAELLSTVGLPADSMDRKVTEFSGGQRQRLAIARALALGPKLLVLDEALSGLDLSTQAQIANLLLQLQAAQSLTYLLISHDLALVARMADVVAVMSAGRIVEVGPSQQIVSSPKHYETKMLLAAAEGIRSRYDATRGLSS
jgi:peptide/nickel transport system ATP-binding protein